MPVDDGWRVTGRKAWVSLAGEADVFVLVCRTGTERGTGDVLMLAVDARTDGVRVERLYDKAAGAFLPIGEVSYDEVHVPTYALLAPAGQGMRAALGAIDVARVDIAAISVGLAAEALAVALDYARGREAFGGTLLDLQSIQFALADVETDVVTGRLLYRAAAAALDAGDGSVLAAHAKRFCPDAALRAAIACSEVLGAYGLLQRVPARALPRARQDAAGRRRHHRGAAHRHRARARAALRPLSENAPRSAPRGSERAARARAAARPSRPPSAARRPPRRAPRRRRARARAAKPPASTPKRSPSTAPSSRGVSAGRELDALIGGERPTRRRAAPAGSRGSARRSSARLRPISATRQERREQPRASA